MTSFDDNNADAFVTRDFVNSFRTMDARPIF